MTRLIDADAVYKILESCEIRKATIGNPLTDWEYGYTCGIERAESEIECAPTVDAVPVIRCYECKYFKEFEKGFSSDWDGSCRYWNTHSTVYSNFCGCGARMDKERKEEWTILNWR